MKNSFFTAIIFLPILAFANGVGNGGDELRFQFIEGQNDAAQRISALKRCSFQPSAPPQVIDWILKNKLRLASDILSSPHVWITDNQSTCAFTQTQSSYPVTLSFLSCRGISSKEEAGRLLAHESAHHIGISDETFADEVAFAIYDANTSVTCKDPGHDLFDPLSCQGTFNVDVPKYFAPGSIESKVAGAYQVLTRERICTQATGCNQWASVPNPEYYYGYSASLPATGNIIFDLDAQWGFRIFFTDPAHYDGAGNQTPITALATPGLLAVPLSNPENYVLRPLVEPYNRRGTYGKLEETTFGENCFRTVVRAEKHDSQSSLYSERETIFFAIFQ